MSKLFTVANLKENKNNKNGQIRGNYWRKDDDDDDRKKECGGEGVEISLKILFPLVSLLKLQIEIG